MCLDCESGEYTLCAGLGITKLLLVKNSHKLLKIATIHYNFEPKSTILIGYLLYLYTIPKMRTSHGKA